MNLHFTYLLTYLNRSDSFHRHFNAQFTLAHPTLFILGGWYCKTTYSYVYHHEWSGHYCACYCCWTQTTATPFPILAEVSTAVVLNTTVLARCQLQLCCDVREFRGLTAEWIDFMLTVIHCNLCVCWYFTCITIFCNFWLFSLWLWISYK